MLLMERVGRLEFVVPHEGTWIEMDTYRCECKIDNVVPHEGTWIEMYIEMKYDTGRLGRSPRGNVD